MKDRYSFIAILDYADDGISIEFPDLPGCLSCADRNNTEQALHNAKEALGLHLWGMEKDGEEIPAPTPIIDLHYESNQVPAVMRYSCPLFGNGSIINL